MADSFTILAAACNQEGCKRPIYASGLCSAHYLRNRNYGYTGDHRLKCARCGEWFNSYKKRAHCLNDGCVKARQRKRGVIPLADYKAQVRASAKKYYCENCGSEFLANGGTNANKYCSRDCNIDHKRASSEVAQQIAKEAAIYKRWSMGYGRGMEATKHQRWGSRSRAPCIECGSIVGVGRTRIRSAKRCAACNVVEKGRLRRVLKGARKARIRNLRVEPVDPIKVFDRDAWKCQMCGVKTPIKLRGTYKPNAPELDHIVPLSKGGSHSYANVQCSCRQCNGSKSNKIYGQLNLLPTHA